MRFESGELRSNLVQATFKLWLIKLDAQTLQISLQVFKRDGAARLKDREQGLQV